MGFVNTVADCKLILTYLRQGMTQGQVPYQLRLSSVNRTPTIFDTVADWADIVYPSYAPTSLGAWGQPYYDSSGVPTIDYPPVKYSFTTAISPPIVVYSYYITSTFGGLVGAELLATARTIYGIGEVIEILPRRKLYPIT